MAGFSYKTKVIAYLCQHICIVDYCFASPFEKSLTHEGMSTPFAEENKEDNIDQKVGRIFAFTLIFSSFLQTLIVHHFLSTYIYYEY